MIVHAGHTSWVNSVTFSPDGKSVASGSWDNTVRMWDAYSSSQIGEPLRGHSGSINSVSYSPLGNLIASGSLDKTIRLWDPNTGHQVGQSLRGDNPFISIAFAPDANLIASGSGGPSASPTGHAVQLWDVQSRTAVSRPFKGHLGGIESVSFSPDGTRVASGSFDKTVRLWDAETGAEIFRPLTGHRNAVRSLAFSPDGAQIVSCSMDRTILLRDSRSGKTIGKPYNGHVDWVNSVSFSPRGTHVASGGNDNTIHLWDIRNGAQVIQSFKEHTDCVSSVAFSPTAQYIASGSYDFKVIVRRILAEDSKSYDDDGPPTVTDQTTQSGRSLMAVHEGQTPSASSTAPVSEDETVRIGDTHDSSPLGKPLSGRSSPMNSLPSSLIASYKDRFKHVGELTDIEKAIEYYSQAVAMAQEDDLNVPELLAKLGVSHFYRFGHLGELRDLEQAIECQSRALALTPDGHPQLSTYLSNLALCYKDRFGRLGELGDLEQAIECQSRGLMSTPDDHPQLSTYLANQSVLYKDRFRRLGDLADLELAIGRQSRALALTPESHPEMSAHLANLALCYKDRFGRLGELSDLERAIECQSRALDLTPESHPEMSAHLTNLALCYKDRFERLGELGDLERAIEWQSRALALTPDDYPELSSRLADLAMSYSNRFERLGGIRDLDQAIEYQSRALALAPDDHPHSCLWHFNHATFYVHYYTYSHDPSHLYQALPLFRTACIPSTGSPRDRFQNAHKWANLASTHSALHPIEAYQAAIDLLPQFIWLGAAADQRYQDLKSIQTLAVDAAHAAIISSNHSLALEWLEHARCIAWNQNLMLRSPLDQLQASHPELATRLQIVTAELHAASTNSRESLASSRFITFEQVAQDHRRLALEYEQLLAQVRTQPGFEDFLRPMNAAGLMHAARNGPIVVINCHEERSDAIMVLPNQSTIAHLCLPSFSSRKAQDAHSAIQSLLSRNRTPQHDSDFDYVLMMLWVDVVKPVLDFLGLLFYAPGDILPHITWCPTGAASFLPLHAAGDYSQPAGSRVFNYVVSSYTPNLTALLSSAPSTLGRDPRVLAIGQAATPGLSLIPGITVELELVKSHVENRAGYSELIDTEATPATVLDAMEQHDWVHFACHAHQNVNDPTKSGFFLYDGILDLAAINRRSFNKKGLAYLSAPETAKGDETLPDEAVHLASGMLMAGYSSVIATMWSIDDSDAPFVADKVYSQLMKEGTLGNGEAGRALHDAVAGLRERIGEKEFGRWVPFIHIGS